MYPFEPDHVFRSELEEAYGLSLVDAVLKLKAIFRVSWKTVVYRIASEREEPGRIWRKFHTDYRRKYGRSLKGVDEPNGLAAEEFHWPSPGLRLGEEPENLNASLFREDRLSRLVRKALDEEKITLSRAAEILDVPAAEMRQLASSWLE